MGFGDRLIHSLTIVRTTFDDAEDQRDEYQQPAVSTEDIGVRGLVQPRSAKELADSRSAGSDIGDHVVFLEPITLYGSDALIWNDTGQRLEIIGIRSLLFGSSPHHEVDVQSVTPAPVLAGGS